MRPAFESVLGGRSLAPRRLVGHALFLVTFIGAKVLGLAGMLLLARIADPALYGAVEVALATALIVSGVGLLGTPGGTTRMALAMEQPRVADLLAFAGLCISLPATAGAVAGLLLGWSPVLVLILAACAPACFQATAATYARISRKPLINSAVDPFALLSLLAAAGGLWAFGSLTMGNLALVTTVISAAVTVLMGAAFLYARAPAFLAKYVGALKISAPFLALGGVTIIVGSIMRPALSAVAPLDQVAAYSLCFRLFAPVMLIHQVVTTGFFARLYQMASAKFDLVCGAMIGCCLTVVLAVFLMLDPIIHYGFPNYVASLDILRAVFPLVGLQVILWIILAWMEMQVGRHGVAGRVAVTGYVVLAITMLAVIAWPPEGLALAVLGFDTALLVFFLAQAALLWRLDIRLKVTAPMTVLAFVALVGMHFVMS